MLAIWGILMVAMLPYVAYIRIQMFIQKDLGAPQLVETPVAWQKKRGTPSTHPIHFLVGGLNPSEKY